MITSRSLRGVMPVAPTPFLENGQVDWQSFNRLLDFYRDISCAGVTVLGVLGEASKLSDSEMLDVARATSRAFGDKPIIVGVSALGFVQMQKIACDAMEAGAYAVMLAPPSHLRTDDSIVDFYVQAAHAIGTDVPFVIQDYPLVTNVLMTSGVIRRIVQECPTCVMLKAEDWPGLEKISTLRQWQADGSMRSVAIMSANGGLFLDFEAERGVDGSNTGYAYPEMLIGVLDLLKAGNRDEAHDLFDSHLPLLRYEQQPSIGLAVRKYVYMRRGIFSSDTQRKPCGVLSSLAIEEIDYLIRRLESKGHDLRRR